MTSLHIAVLGAPEGFLPRTPFVAPDAMQRMYLAWIRVREQISTPIEELKRTGDPDWLLHAYRLGAEGYDEEIVFNMMSSVNEMLHAGEFEAVNTIIANLKERDSPLVVVEGLLRFCFRSRGRLPDWDGLKDRLMQEAARRGDTEEISFR
jgi:hypothetical protein